MSGRKIHDHSFWAGGRSKDSVLPKGVHHKHESSDGHAAALGKYEDTTEAIHAQQEMAMRKVKAHEHKNGTRN